MNPVSGDSARKRSLYALPVLVTVLVGIALVLFWWVATQSDRAPTAPVSRAPAQTRTDLPPVVLTDAERAYLKQLGPVKMCVDPDWEPYEIINAQKQHEGIAADLVRLIATRAGVTLELVPTKDWSESISFSKAGTCHILSFLNQTPAREEWLTFTDPYFSDPNVFITREEHEFISNAAALTNERIVVPEGSSIAERVANDFPNLTLILSGSSEQEAFDMVNNRQAEMTLRSLTMAAYTIKKQGLFNLKIAGQAPNYTNQFRIGVIKTEPRLRDILNKGVTTVSPQEVRQTVNDFISIRAETVTDYTLVTQLGAIFALVLIGGLVWNYQLRKLNTTLAARQAELVALSQQLQAQATTDELTGAANRRHFIALATAELNRARRMKTPAALALIDIDYFKQVNDTYGHAAGDLALRTFTEICRANLREIDIFARVGGDEFALVLPGTDCAQAFNAVERVRAMLSAKPLSYQGQTIALTISAGIACDAEGAVSLDDLLGRADRALYQVKTAGRNHTRIEQTDAAADISAPSAHTAAA